MCVGVHGVPVCVHAQEMARGAPPAVPASEPSRVVRMEPLDESRFEVEAPTGAAAEDVDAWIAAVANAKAQLEHTLVRQVNVDLLTKFGTAAWRRECDQLEKIAERCVKCFVLLRPVDSSGERRGCCSACTMCAPVKWKEMLCVLSPPTLLLPAA